MEFPELGFFFSNYFKFWNWFEIGLKIAKIAIFLGVCQSLKCVKFGMSNEFLEKVEKRGFSLEFWWKNHQKRVFSHFWPKIIKKIFLPQLPEAITFFVVIQFSISQLIRIIWDIFYQNQLKNRKSDHFERRESENKKGAPRIRGPSDEKLKSPIFQGISLKLAPVHLFIIRNWYQTHLGCFSWF